MSALTEMARLFDGMGMAYRVGIVDDALSAETPIPHEAVAERYAMYRSRKVNTFSNSDTIRLGDTGAEREIIIVDAETRFLFAADGAYVGCTTSDGDGGRNFYPAGCAFDPFVRDGFNYGQ